MRIEWLNLIIACIGIIATILMVILKDDKKLIIGIFLIITVCTIAIWGSISYKTINFSQNTKALTTSIESSSFAIPSLEKNNNTINVDVERNHRISR